MIGPLASSSQANQPSAISLELRAKTLLGLVDLKDHVAPQTHRPQVLVPLQPECLVE